MKDAGLQPEIKDTLDQGVFEIIPDRTVSADVPAFLFAIVPAFQEGDKLGDRAPVIVADERRSFHFFPFRITPNW